MRDIPYSFNEKLHQRIQTKATQADPRPSLWISRKTTQLTDSVFLESSVVAEGNISDCSIAVRHKRFGFESDSIFMAYIQNGVAKLRRSPTFTEMAKHIWTDCDFQQPAEAVSIVFNGTMPKDTRNKYEFITDEQPWVFWINAGAVYGQAPDGTVHTLATENATGISAVRSMWSDVPSFDFGLVLFMILNGDIYYRQLIKGIWYDAEALPSSAVPEGKTWVAITAQRTWDYRTVIMAKDSEGLLYEIFSQYGGMGSKGGEHLKISRIDVSGILTAIHYHTAMMTESICVSGIEAGAPYGGIYDVRTPSIISAFNLDNGEGDWGKQARFVFDIHLSSTEVSSNFGAFSIVDELGMTYPAASAVLGDDGKTVTLTFADINNAFGSCTAKYSPGSVHSMAGTVLDETAVSFTPENLVPSLLPVPEYENASNMDDLGTAVVVTFSLPITSDVSNSPSSFVLTTTEYDYVPDGSLSSFERGVSSVERYASLNDLVNLDAGILTNTKDYNGVLKLAGLEATNG